MTSLICVWLTVGLLGIEQLYVHLARCYRLFELPNERSLHTEQMAIRGGGIIFYVAALVALHFSIDKQVYFLVGLTLVALISFLDDLHQVPKRYRLIAHAIAIILLGLQIGPFSTWQWTMIGAVIIGIGILNMFNFMDGINGMTAFYGLTTVGSLWGWEVYNNVDSSPILLPCIWIALAVFSFYNARKQAICFAGDVGSITLGFVVVYALLKSINQQNTYLPLLFLAVYGVDTTLTIIHRFWDRQNIFQAHQLHLFQLVVRQKKYSHLTVAGFYAVLQGVINGLVCVAMNWSPLVQAGLAVLILVSLSSAYIVIRRPLMHKKRSTLRADLSKIN